MGAIANSVKRSSGFPGSERGESLWRQVFGDRATDKEEPMRRPQVRQDPNSYLRSPTSVASQKRLLQAMRSPAPGGWTDDRQEQTRHYVGITYTAVHRQNELLTQCEFQVFMEDPHHPDGKRPVTPDDPPQGDRQVRPYDLVKLLKNPNPDDSFGDLMAQWNLQMDLTGMGLTWMVPNALGVPMQLYPIPTAIAVPQPAVNPEFPDGFYRIQPVYPYGPFSTFPTPNSAVGAPISAKWMMRFKYPHPLLRYEGYSPLSGMRQHIDQHESMDKSRWHAMQQSINPSAVMNFGEVENAQPLPPDEVERIHAEWENEFHGPENAGKLIVGYPGSTLEPWGNRPVDMDYPSGWEQVMSFVLGGGFGITKPAVGMTDSSSYAQVWASLKQTYWLTLDPKTARVGAGLTRTVGPFFGDNLIVEVRCKRIDDHEVKGAKLDKLIQAKAITKNELRKELEMPLTKDEWGGDMAGDPSPKEQEQIEQQQQGDALQGASQPTEEAGLAGEGPLGNLLGGDEGGGEEEGDIEDETDERPDTGTLGAGALGPRMKLLLKGKALTPAEKAKMSRGRKSFYDIVRGSLNGNGRH